MGCCKEEWKNRRSKQWRFWYRKETWWKLAM
nr:MAG TPA: hypothetical protein [Caudoviricetes sp.]